jgi:hypothetical protein
VASDRTIYEERCVTESVDTSGSGTGLVMVPADVECHFIATGTVPPPASTQTAATPEPAADEGVASGLVTCGATGQQACQACDIVGLVNSVVAWLVLILGTIAAIIIVIAGAKLVLAGGNQHAMQDAKSMITNMIIGYVIVLAGWLLIDTGLKALLNDNNYGVWNQIQCVDQPESVFKPYVPIYTPADIVREYGTVSPALAPALPVAGNCSPANLATFGMTATQAQVFSCIAQAESGCNLTADNPASSAYGAFQVLRGYDNTCHNLNLPQCTAAAQAAGYSVTGNLNCSQAFRNGDRIPGPNPLADACDAAAANLACNTAAALCLYNDGSGYGPWMGDDANPHEAQRACVARYGVN